jgi:hypothetical protein
MVDKFIAKISSLNVLLINRSFVLCPFLLDDIPFSFSEGPQDGKSKVAVLRLFQDWVNRDAKRVLAARSQFSIGLNAFGATKNDGSVPDGQFFAWLG